MSTRLCSLSGVWWTLLFFAYHCPAKYYKRNVITNRNKGNFLYQNVHSVREVFGSWTLAINCTLILRTSYWSSRLHGALQLVAWLFYLLSAPPWNGHCYCIMYCRMEAMVVICQQWHRACQAAVLLGLVRRVLDRHLLNTLAKVHLGSGRLFHRRHRLLPADQRSTTTTVTVCVC